LLLLPPAFSLLAFFFELAPSPSAALRFLFSSTTSFQALTIDLARAATALQTQKDSTCKRPEGETRSRREGVEGSYGVVCVRSLPTATPALVSYIRADV
jgi:hypothetical protein